MVRKPMDTAEAGKHAQATLRKSEKYLNRNRVTNDQEAFNRIKQKVHTPNLAAEILEAFKPVKSLTDHRRE